MRRNSKNLMQFQIKELFYQKGFHSLPENFNKGTTLKA